MLRCLYLSRSETSPDSATTYPFLNYNYTPNTYVMEGKSSSTAKKTPRFDDKDTLWPLWTRIWSVEYVICSFYLSYHGHRMPLEFYYGLNSTPASFLGTYIIKISPRYGVEYYIIKTTIVAPDIGILKRESNQFNLKIQQRNFQ